MGLPDVSTDDSPEWVTTSTVLQRLGDFQDRDAWGSFAKRFRAPVVTFAAQRGLSATDAEDVAQETLIAFASAYKAGQYDREKGRLSAWLFGIANRRVENLRRKNRVADERQNPVAQETGFWNDVPGDEAVGKAWDEVWERSLMEQAVRQVRKEFQPSTFRVFEMIVLEKREVEEASAELRLTRNAVYVARHRVMARMRELLIELEAVG